MYRYAIVAVMVLAVTAIGSAAWWQMGPARARCSDAAARKAERMAELHYLLDPEAMLSVVARAGDAPPGYALTPVPRRTPTIGDAVATYEADPKVLSRYRDNCPLAQPDTATVTPLGVVAPLNLRAHRPGARRTGADERLDATQPDGLSHRTIKIATLWRDADVEEDRTPPRRFA